jgi:hypothetical protein
VSEPDLKPPYGLMYAGLAFAALANVLISVMAVVQWHQPGIISGNLSATVISLGGIWLIRQRQKGRL